jgi:hypothetical protein
VRHYPRFEEENWIREASRLTPPTHRLASVRPSPRVKDAGWIQAASRFALATGRRPRGCPGPGWGAQGRTNGNFVFQCWAGGARPYGCRSRQVYFSGLSWQEAVSLSLCGSQQLMENLAMGRHSKQDRQRASNRLAMHVQSDI